MKVLLSPLWRSLFLFYGIRGRLSSGKGLGFGIDNIAPVQVAPGQAQHQHFRRGQVAGIGDVVLVTQTEDVGYILIRGLLIGVAEAQHHVDLIIGDTGRDLLAAAVVEGQETVE